MSRTTPPISIFAVTALLAAFAGCAGAPVPPVKSQQYARLPNKRSFEFEFPVVWKGIESAMRNLKVTDRNPAKVDALELRKLSRRTLETDWFYSQSRDKYQEYQANGSPRKVYLQTRLKYEIEAQRTLGGVDVTVATKEEVEKLRADGTPDGYEESESPDPSRAAEMLDRIYNAILSAVP